jgi:hypothetical protein
VGDGGQILHAITIEAPRERVWPWLAQIGQDRGGFYSYEWLENLAGCALSNANEIHPEWQHRELGERIPLHPAFGLELTVFDPPRAIGLDHWGTFVLEEEGPERTRLLARGRVGSGGIGAWIRNALFEIPHFVMERRMLLGIKQRAERRGEPRRRRGSAAAPGAPTNRGSAR